SDPERVPGERVDGARIRESRIHRVLEALRDGVEAMRNEQDGIDGWLAAPSSQSVAAVEQLIDSAKHVLEIDVRRDAAEPAAREGRTPLKIEHGCPRPAAAIARCDLSEIVEDALACAG